MAAGGSATNAMTVAKWFAAWADANDADLSNLKLQKLLYYAQGHHLGAGKGLLFADPITAWAHGPVVKDVYHAFKSFESGDIRLDDDDPFEWDEVDEETTDFLISVWNAYGGYGAWRLRNMTHAEGGPWAETFDPDGWSDVIPVSLIESHFKPS